MAAYDKFVIDGTWFDYPVVLHNPLDKF